MSPELLNLYYEYLNEAYNFANHRIPLAQETQQGNIEILRSANQVLAEFQHQGSQDYPSSKGATTPLARVRVNEYEGLRVAEDLAEEEHYRRLGVLIAGRKNGEEVVLFRITMEGAIFNFAGKRINDEEKGAVKHFIELIKNHLREELASKRKSLSTDP